MALIGRDQRDLRTETGKLSDRVQIQNQILVQRHSRTLQLFRQQIVISNLRFAKLQWRVEHEQRPPAAFDACLDGVDFRLLVVTGWSSDHDDRAVGWNLSFLEQIDRFRFVLIFPEQFLESRVAVAIGIIDLMLAAAVDKTNRAGPIFQNANKGAGDAFFRQTLCLFLFAANLYDRRAVILDAGGARNFGALVGIDVFDMNFRREVRILIQNIFRLIVSGALIEIAYRRVLVQFSDDLLGLIRKAVALVRGPVIRFVVTIRQHIHHHHGGDNYRYVNGNVARELRLSGLE